MSKKDVALILAGGRGSRMDFFCNLRPKPMLPFAGELHVIDFTISNCIHSSLLNIAALVDYQRSYMSGYLREWAAMNADSAKISILQPIAASYTGTADAVYQNLSWLQSEASDRILVLAGDHVYKMDYRKMLAFHDRVAADVTIGVIRVPVEEVHRFGTIAIDGESRVRGFVEKSRAPLSLLASMGIYVFNKDILCKRLNEDAGKKDSPHDFGYAILPEMVRHDRVFAYEFRGYWQDIGTIEAYYHANMELLLTRPRFSLDSNWPILTENHDLPTPQQSKDGRVVNSIISSGCIVRGYVENSILSPGVHVDEKATVRNSIIMSHASIGYQSVIDTTILDEGVNVGKFCYVGFGESFVPDNPNITLIGKEVVIPGQTAIGRMCKILPKAGLHDFAGAFIPPGTTIRYSPTVV